jgi:hypothetical protein
MTYRVPSNAVWHSLPGCVSAYQSIGAPDFIAARQNVGAHMRQLGLYTATPGVAPTWNSRTGWGFDGINQYLNTGVIPASGWSAVLRYSGATYAAANNNIFGSVVSGSNARLYIIVVGTTGEARYGNGTFITGGGTARSAGVAATTLGTGYFNGIVDIVAAQSWDHAGVKLYIGAYNNTDVAPVLSLGGLRVQSLAIYSRTLSPSEVWLASQQMQYCDTIPDYNAWARRRSYWIPASLAMGGSSKMGLLNKGIQYYQEF